MKEIRVFDSGKFRYVGTYTDGVFQQGFYEKSQRGVPKEGDIYLGRVESFDKGKKNVFVNIGCSKNAIMPLRRDDNVKLGDTFAVEIIRGEKDLKGAKVSLSYTLPGEYVILRNSRKKITVSRSMKKEEIPEELWNILKEFSRDFQGEVSVRSAILQCDDSDMLRAELGELLSSYENIEKKSNYSSVIERVYDGGGILGRVKRDEGRNVVVENDVIGEERIRRGDFLTHVMNVYRRKVELPGGGSMVIDKTEAMYTIDINSGRGNSRKVNQENAGFICREILRRNLNGMILIDFINFSDKKLIEPLANDIRAEMNRDSVKGKVFFNKDLGLIEIARNRKGMTIYEILDEVKDDMFSFQRNINMDEALEIIKGMITEIYEGVKGQKNKAVPRVIIKLNPFFYGRLEGWLDELRAKKEAFAPGLSLSYNSDFVMGYSIY